MQSSTKSRRDSEEEFKGSKPASEILKQYSQASSMTNESDSSDDEAEDMNFKVQDLIVRFYVFLTSWVVLTGEQHAQVAFEAWKVEIRWLYWQIVAQTEELLQLIGR